MSQVVLIKVPITKRQSSVGVMVQESPKLSLLTLRPVHQTPASSSDRLIKTSSKPALISYHTVIATLIAAVKGKGSEMCHGVTALTHIPTSVFVCVWRRFDKPQCVRRVLGHLSRFLSVLKIVFASNDKIVGMINV